MRRAVVVFFVANLLLVGFLVRSVSTLLRLLVEDGSADAIHRAELPVPDVQSDLLPQIPKIIHQTYINDSIPARWEGPRRSCLDLHEDYEYMVCVLTPAESITMWARGRKSERERERARARGVVCKG